MGTVDLFRVIVPVQEIERAQEFYSRVLNMTGELIGPGRHYFYCGPTILACVQISKNFRPNIDNVYFAVDDLEAAFQRVQDAISENLGGAFLEGEYGVIDTRAWGERSFYVRDPFGNPICFVDSATKFTGGRFVP